VIVSFIRHASTAWNEQGRMQGRRDIPLSAAGRAEVASWRIPGRDGSRAEWVSSPLSRAVETARSLGGREPSRESALIEMDWGEWEGSTLAELRTRFGDAFARNANRGLDFRPPGGESPRDVVARVARWLDAVAQHRQPTVAVTHSGVLRALLAIATGWDMMGKPPVRLASGRLHRFVVERGPALRIVEWNVPLAGDSAEPAGPPGEPLNNSHVERVGTKCG